MHFQSRDNRGFTKEDKEIYHRTRALQQMGYTVEMTGNSCCITRKDNPSLYIADINKNRIAALQNCIKILEDTNFDSSARSTYENMIWIQEREDKLLFGSPSEQNYRDKQNAFELKEKHRIRQFNNKR